MTETTIIMLTVAINDTNANVIAVIRMIRKVFECGLKEAKDINDEFFVTASYLDWRRRTDAERKGRTAPDRWSTRRSEFLLDEATAAKWLLENELDGRPFEMSATRKRVVMQ